MLAWSHALMLIAHMLGWSYAPMLTCLEDHMLPFSLALSITCSMLTCFNDPMLTCFDDRILYVHMHWYSLVWYPYIYTHTWMMICLYPWSLKRSCSWTFVCLNTLRIVLECWGNFVVRGMCTWKKNAHMLAWSHAHILVYSCSHPSIYSYA